MNDRTPMGPNVNTADVEISVEQRRALQAGLDTVAARTREYLPDEYVVGAQIIAGTDGPQGTIAVQPPVGAAVSAGFTPDFEDLSDGIAEEDRTEVARQLAASAALQVKQAVSDGITPVGR
jgi:hypothetical protein